VSEHESKKTADGFETSGTLLLDGGLLNQKLRVYSVGDQTIVYEDRLAAVSDVTANGERGVPVGIENDEIAGGRRIVSDQNGAHRIEWHPTNRDGRKLNPAIVLSGSWANVDDRLGVVMLAGSGIVDQQASGY
jgi:hypothetical protein